MIKDFSAVEQNRVRRTVNPIFGNWGTDPGDDFGMFIFHEGRTQLRVIVAPGDETGWEHVSVSCLYLNAHGKPVKRVPTWAEMCRMKAAFFLLDECVVEFHPPEEDYVNNAPNCLHLWRWTRGDFPMPNHIMVGFTGNKAKDAAAMAKLLQEMGQ